jgi:hypothetical protein
MKKEEISGVLIAAARGTDDTALQALQMFDDPSFEKAYHSWILEMNLSNTNK